MQAADFEPFRKMMALVAEQYGKTMSPDLIRLYFDGLAHLPIETVSAALQKHIRNTDTGQWMPKIADVIRACEGKSEDAAYLALVELQGAFSSVGAWRSVEFTDAITRTVVRDMGGWPELCNRDAEEWAKFGAADFMRRYRIYKARGEVDAPAYLPGYFERANQQAGNGERVQIGRKETLKLPKRAETHEAPVHEPAS